jgi:hypothetical protein
VLTRHTTAADTQIMVTHRLRTKKLATKAPIITHMAMLAIFAALYIHQSFKLSNGSQLLLTKLGKVAKTVNWPPRAPHR